MLIIGRVHSILSKCDAQIKMCEFIGQNYQFRIIVKNQMSELRKIIHSYAVKHTNNSEELHWIFPVGNIASFDDSDKSNCYDPNTIMSPMSCTRSFFRPKNDEVLKERTYWIAIKELIIEWEDYQNENAGYIYCEAALDEFRESWIETSYGAPNVDIPEPHPRQKSNFQQLLQFVKPPGRKITYIKVTTEQLLYVPIDLHKCRMVMMVRGGGRSYSVRRHELRCELKSLFGENELQIKHAHMTVEVIIK